MSREPRRLGGGTFWFGCTQDRGYSRRLGIQGTFALLSEPIRRFVALLGIVKEGVDRRRWDAAVIRRRAFAA